MVSSSPNSLRKTRIWIVLLAALALLSFLAMRRNLEKALGMKAETTLSSALPELQPGEKAKIVLELTAVVPAAKLEGNLLEKQTETVYHRTPGKLEVAFDGATPIVMGKPSDLHLGAVVHISATMTAGGLLRAEQIVVLTGYVRVQ